MRDAPGAIFQDLRGTSDGIAGDGGAKGLRLFLPFYLLKATAGNSERSSDGCEEGDRNLQNRFPGICFHHLYYYF
jgi:hypothetical protein